jgi:hypothetical protein
MDPNIRSTRALVRPEVNRQERQQTHIELSLLGVGLGVVYVLTIVRTFTNIFLLIPGVLLRKQKLTYEVTLLSVYRPFIVVR